MLKNEVNDEEPVASPWRYESTSSPLNWNRTLDRILPFRFSRAAPKQACSSGSSIANLSAPAPLPVGPLPTQNGTKDEPTTKAEEGQQKSLSFEKEREERSDTFLKRQEILALFMRNRENDLQAFFESQKRKHTLHISRPGTSVLPKCRSDEGPSMIKEDEGGISKTKKDQAQREELKALDRVSDKEKEKKERKGHSRKRSSLKRRGKEEKEKNRMETVPQPELSLRKHFSLGILRDKKKNLSLDDRCWSDLLQSNEHDAAFGNMPLSARETSSSSYPKSKKAGKKVDRKVAVKEAKQTKEATQKKDAAEKEEHGNDDNLCSTEAKRAKLKKVKSDLSLERKEEQKKRKKSKTVPNKAEKMLALSREAHTTARPNAATDQKDKEEEEKEKGNKLEQEASASLSCFSTATTATATASLCRSRASFDLSCHEREREKITRRERDREKGTNKSRRKKGTPEYAGGLCSNGTMTTTTTSKVLAEGTKDKRSNNNNNNNATDPAPASTTATNGDLLRLAALEREVAAMRDLMTAMHTQLEQLRAWKEQKQKEEKEKEKEKKEKEKKSHHRHYHHHNNSHLTMIASDKSHNSGGGGAVTTPTMPTTMNSCSSSIVIGQLRAVNCSGDGHDDDDDHHDDHDDNGGDDDNDNKGTSKSTAATTT